MKKGRLFPNAVMYMLFIYMFIEKHIINFAWESIW